jgi:hypothetical protein
MVDDRRFARTDPELLPVLEELKRREPIFHATEFGTTVDDFERSVAPDYWEVGATGRRYSREFILETFRTFPPVAEADEFECRDFSLQQLGQNTYLLTYTLKQWERLTRRATIWQRMGDHWRILYHQGTAVTYNEDDMVPGGESEAAEPPDEADETKETPGGD